MMSETAGRPHRDMVRVVAERNVQKRGQDILCMMEDEANLIGYQDVVLCHVLHAQEVRCDTSTSYPGGFNFSSMMANAMTPY